MSKLLDRLERIGRGSPAAIGFAAARAERIPGMALIGVVSGSSNSTRGASALAKMEVDGALIEGPASDAAIKKLAKALDNVPWGLRLQELKGEEASGLKESGCDFLAFEPAGVLLGALEDTDTGYLLCIQPDMEERSLRAIEDLPIDAVILLLKSAKPPLTLQHLMTIGSVRAEFSKNLLVEIGGAPTAAELQVLKDIGVEGLVLDSTTASAEELQTLKENLLSMPKRTRSRSRKPGAILPRSVYPGLGAPAAEDDEEEEEDRLA